MAIPVGGTPLLLQLSPGMDHSWTLGQRLRVVVLGERDGQVLLRLAGATLTAESRLPLEPGQRLHLRVAGMEAGQVLLEILPPAALTEPAGTARLLGNLGLPPTPQREEAAVALLQAEVPPTAERIEAFRVLSDRLGGMARSPQVQGILARLAGRGILPQPPALRVLVTMALQMGNAPPPPGPPPAAAAALLPLLRLFWSDSPEGAVPAPPPGESAAPSPAGQVPAEGSPAALQPSADQPAAAAPTAPADLPAGVPSEVPSQSLPGSPTGTGRLPAEVRSPKSPPATGLPAPQGPFASPGQSEQVLRMVLHHLHPLGPQAHQALEEGNPAALANLPFLLVGHLLSQGPGGLTFRLPLADDPEGATLSWRRKGGPLRLRLRLPRLGEMAAEFWPQGDGRLLVLLRAREEGTRALLRGAAGPLQERLLPRWPRAQVSLAPWQEGAAVDAGSGLDLRL